jgi:hypothetical protein
MNDQLVLTIAETILANTKLLQSLVDTLPKATVAKITEKVEKVTKATPVAAPVQVTETATPAVVETAAAPVVETITPPVVGNATPPVAVVTPIAPAPAPAPVFVAVAATPAAAPTVPFTDHPGLLKWIMDSYQKLGAEKGAQIQTVLGSIGVRNINDVKPDQWAALVAGVSALG